MVEEFNFNKFAQSGGSRIITNPQQAQQQTRQTLASGGSKIQSNPSASKPPMSGGGRSRSNNPLNLPVQQNSLTQAMENKKSTLPPSKPLQIIDKPTVRPTQSYGTLIVNSNEAKQFYQSNKPVDVPYYEQTAKTTQGAIVEGSLVGQTPIYTTDKSFSNPITTRSQFELTRANLERTKDIYKDVEKFQSNPKDFKGAVGVSTSEGYSYSLPSNYFGKYFTSESNIHYARVGRAEFESLPQYPKMIADTGQTLSAGAKGIVSLGEINLGKTFLYNFGVQQLTPERKANQELLGIQTRNLGAFQNVNRVPAEPTIYGTTKIPIVTKLTGLELPKSIRDTRGYVGEIGKRPEVLINTASVVGIGGVAIRGVVAAKSIYTAEIASGATKLQAINTIGGEALYSISPIRYGGFGNERVFITNTKRLYPFGTTQVNKGDLLTIEQAPQQPNFFTASGKGVYATPIEVEYVSVRPKLSGIDITGSSLIAGEKATVTIGKNIFAVKPSEIDGVTKAAGGGRRTIDIQGLKVVSQGRYDLGLEPYSKSFTENFRSAGRSTKVTENLNFGMSESRFTPSPSKVGRPKKAIGADFSTKIVEYESPTETTAFGKVISKSKSGGRKGVDIFTTKTIIPKNVEPDKFSLTITPKDSGGASLVGGSEFKLTTKQVSESMGSAIKDALTTPKASPKSSFVNMQPPSNIPKMSGGVIGSYGSSIGFVSIQSDFFQTGFKPISGFTTQQMNKQFIISNQQQFKITEMQIPTSNLRTLQLQNPVIDNKNIQTNQPVEVFRTIQTQSPVNIMKNIQTQYPVNVLKNDFVSNEILKSPPSTIMNYKSRFGLDIIPETPPVFGLPFGGLNLDLGGFLGSAKSGKQKKRRVPSIYAAEMGITASSASPLEITGIALRPIITGRRKK